MTGLDLFGQVILGPRRPGRPRHVPTAELRALARQMRLSGSAQPVIAEALGITIPTLRRHYAVEIETQSQAWRKYAPQIAGVQNGND